VDDQERLERRFKVPMTPSPHFTTMGLTRKQALTLRLAVMRSTEGDYSKLELMFNRELEERHGDTVVLHLSQADAEALIRAAANLIDYVMNGNTERE
jgi:hypothetical protein